MVQPEPDDAETILRGMAKSISRRNLQPRLPAFLRPTAAPLHLATCTDLALGDTMNDAAIVARQVRCSTATSASGRAISVINAALLAGTLARPGRTRSRGLWWATIGDRGRRPGRRQATAGPTRSRRDADRFLAAGRPAGAPLGDAVSDGKRLLFGAGR